MDASLREDNDAWPILHFQLDSVDGAVSLPATSSTTGMMIVSWRGDRAVGHRIVKPGEADIDTASLFDGSMALAREGPEDRKAAPSSFARLSVIIPTRDRPEDLERCLLSFSAQSQQPLEIIVVDNAPKTDATSRAVNALIKEAPTIRYVHEPRPGLDFARNAGVCAARGEICAFCDDDVVLHYRWCERLVAAFDRPDVMAMTGLVLPLELSSVAQRLFEFGWGFGRGYERIDFGRAFLESTVREGCPTWEIGAGASMAFRRAAFTEIGLFDERLDAGAAGCSGDSEMWYRVLAKGWTCRYEPAAISFHRHRRDLGELKRQIRAYMRGHVTALFIQFQRHGHWGNLRRVFSILPAHYLSRFVRMLSRRSTSGDLLLKEEVVGSLEGILYFARHSRAAQLVVPRHVGSADDEC